MAGVLIAGCGDLGSAVAQRLVHRGLDVHALRRSAVTLAGVTCHRADVTVAASLSGLAALQPGHLLYCVAADAATDDAYRTHYVTGLANVLAALDGSRLQRVLFVSSSRVYGQQTDDWLDETVPALPHDFGGRRLLEAEALLAASGLPHTWLRLSGIYGPGRQRMLRLARAPHDWPATNGWTNRIHRDDAAAFIAMLVERSHAGMALENGYLVTDSTPAPQHEVLRWLAARQGAPCPAPPPPPVTHGRRLSNRRMLATGFRLQYADYRSGYSTLLEDS